MATSEDDRNGRLVVAIAALNLAGINRGALRAAAASATAECDELARVLDEKRAASTSLADQAKAAEEAFEAAADGLEEFGVDRETSERIVSHIMVELSGSGVDMALPAGGAVDVKPKVQRTRKRRGEEASGTAGAGQSGDIAVAPVASATNGNGAADGGDTKGGGEAVAVASATERSGEVVVAEGASPPPPTRESSAHDPSPRTDGQATLVLDEFPIVHEAGAATFARPEVKAEVAGAHDDGREGYLPPSSTDDYGTAGPDEIWDEPGDGSHAASDGAPPERLEVAVSPATIPVAGSTDAPVLDLLPPSGTTDVNGTRPAPTAPRRPPRPGAAATPAGPTVASETPQAPPRRPEPVVPDFMTT